MDNYTYICNTNHGGIFDNGCRFIKLSNHGKLQFKSRTTATETE